MERLLFDSHPSPMLIYDRASRRILRVNGAFAERYGYSEAEAAKLTIDDIRPEEDLPEFHRALREVKPGGIHDSGVHRHRASDGEVFYVKVTAQGYPYEGYDARLVSLVDVNESVEVEHRYQKLFESANDAILILQDGVFVECNRRSEELFGCPRERILGATPVDFSPPRQPGGETSEERAGVYLAEAARRGQTSFEWEHRTAAGERIFAEVSLNTITFHDEEYVQAIVRDVSERRENETRLRNSLHEKQLLLEEVHHRVKNNLAVISALLEVQILDEEDPRISEILSNSLKRIKTIALVHEMLYRAEDYSRLPLSGYFDRLVSLNREMQVSACGEVEMDMDVEDIDLNINQAIPCAMLLNELINHYYHTLFAREGEGEMAICIYGEGDRVHMEVTAAGSGSPGPEEGEEPLAMTLVRKLSEQLEGEMQLEESGGRSRFELVFVRSASRGSSSHHMVDGLPD